MFSYLEYCLLKLLTTITSRQNIAFRHRLADILTFFWYYFVPYRKEIIKNNLKHAFPTKNDGEIKVIAKETIRQILYCYLDLLPFYSASEKTYEQLVKVENGDIFNQILAKKRGCIVVAYHFGNWEILADWLARNYPKVGAVAKKQKNEMVNNWITKVRAKNGLRIFFKGKRNSWELGNFLNNNGILLLVGDQDARRAGIFIRFLNRPASTFRGPALLALRRDIPVVVGYCIWQKKNYFIHWEEISYQKCSSNLEEDVYNLTQKLANYFEGLIIKNPEYYYWIHRRWKTQPVG